jgi:hypothetical protein
VVLVVEAVAAVVVKPFAVSESSCWSAATRAAAAAAFASTVLLEVIGWALMRHSHERR